jgi:hypothetical protein
MDLTKIDRTFGALDPETQKALKAHGGPYEKYTGGWWPCDNPGWQPGTTYRVKPARD